MEKQRQGVEACGSPDTRPCFYKIVWLANLTDLFTGIFIVPEQIPPAFKEHLLNEEAAQANLRSPCGVWVVQLLHKNGNICFTEGWREFVRFHSLGDKELLIFKYNGSMSFDVVIFLKNGCGKQYQSIGTSHQESPSSFVSSFPFFRHSIKDSNVGRSCIMLIPTAFSRTHLPFRKQEMILQNSEGISWRVSITVMTNKYLCICGGWKAFADYNSIKKGDICIFELVGQNTMKVHIFR